MSRLFYTEQTFLFDVYLDEKTLVLHRNELIRCGRPLNELGELKARPEQFLA